MVTQNPLKANDEYFVTALDLEGTKIRISRAELRTKRVWKTPDQMSCALGKTGLKNQ